MKAGANSAHHGERALRNELSRAAIRLARVLAAHPRTAGPRADALLALMLLQASRLPARLGAAGELVTLAEPGIGR